MNLISSALTNSNLFPRANTGASGGANLDTQQAGSLNAKQLAQNSSKVTNSGDTVSLSNEALAFLQTLTQQSSSSSGAQRPSTDIFSTLDTDGSNTLSQEEFVSGRPGFASEDDAIQEFARLDADEDGTLTSEEIKSGNKPTSTEQAAAGGKPPPPPPPSSGTSSEDKVYDALDTNEDGVVDASELMAGLVEEIEQKPESSRQTENSILTRVSQAISAYTRQ